MELDDFKINKISFQVDNTKNGDNSYASLIDKVKKNLSMQKKRARYFALLDLVIAVIYVTALRENDFNNNIGLTLVCTGLILGAAYLYSKSRMIKNSLYSLPLVNFLEETEKRLTFMGLYDWLAVIPLLLMLGTGGGFILISRLSRYFQNTGMIITIWIVFFTALVVFAFNVSVKDWQKEQGTLLDSVREIKKSLYETNN